MGGVIHFKAQVERIRQLFLIVSRVALMKAQRSSLEISLCPDSAGKDYDASGILA